MWWLGVLLKIWLLRFGLYSVSGLDATGPFFTRYGASLKELDFSIMTFLWNEKYGHKLGSIEGKQLDYFCEPESVQEARYLIWLLEEHRDKFPALHSALDEFFDIMGTSRKSGLWSQCYRLGTCRTLTLTDKSSGVCMWLKCLCFLQSGVENNLESLLLKRNRKNAEYLN